MEQLSGHTALELTGLVLQPDQMHPRIELDPGGCISISGTFISIDPSVFAEPAEEWIRNYIEQPARYTAIRLEFNLLSPDCLKYLRFFLRPLKKLHEYAYDIELFWFIEPDDPDLVEIAGIFTSLLGVPAEIVETDNQYQQIKSRKI